MRPPTRPRAGDEPPYSPLVDDDRPISPLGEAIRRHRELSQFSVRQFAAMAGISNPYLSQIERGLREPSDRVLDAIARTLQTSADALYREAALEPTGDDEHDDDRAGARRAIAEDERLTHRQRRALLEVYDSFVALNARNRRRS
jgi:transcriptional regulator with XRE-family HTH domain